MLPASSSLPSVAAWVLGDGLSGWDRRLESWLAGHRVGALDPVFRYLTYAGTDGAIWLALALTAALSLRGPRVLVLVGLADATAQLATDAIKAAAPRARPHVHTLVAEPHSHSFPSGHAAASFACAVVLAAYLPRFRTLLYVLAAAIAFSRAYVGVHFPLDVIAGSALGGLIGIAFRRVGVRQARAASPGR